MIHFAYKRDNESIRVSQNTMCLVMRAQIIYDNPLLNCKGFLDYLNQKERRRGMYRKLLNFEWDENSERIASLLQ